MAATFTEILSQAQRRGQLTGRKLTQSDVSGIASGYFPNAFTRTMNARKLALQEQALKDSQSNFADELALRKADMEAQQDAASKATKQGYVNTGVQTLGTGALIWGANKGTPKSNPLDTGSIYDESQWAEGYGPTSPYGVDTVTGGTGEAGLWGGNEGVSLVGPSEESVIAQQGNIFSPSGATLDSGTIGTATSDSALAAEQGAVAGAGEAGTIEGGTLAAEGVGTAAAAETGGATLGSIGGGVLSGPALAGVAALKFGGPTLRRIMQKGTRDLTGSEAGSGNEIQKMNRAALDFRGAVTPLYEEFTGNEMPEVVQAVTNPAGYLASKAGCIIVTACTSPDSPEVNLTREYRDKFMSPEQLRGYYMLAEKIVPSIEKSPKLKAFIKKYLVDNLIEYGAFALGKANQTSPKAELVAKAFLGLCRMVGRTRKQFVRANGEAY